jgi:uncharacterized protein
MTRDEVEAVRLHRMAADRGDAEAQMNVGTCLAMGIGVTKDDREAFRYLGLAMTQGHTGVQVQGIHVSHNGPGFNQGMQYRGAWSTTRKVSTRTTPTCPQRIWSALQTKESRSQ